MNRQRGRAVPGESLGLRLGGTPRPTALARFMATMRHRQPQSAFALRHLHADTEGTEAAICFGDSLVSRPRLNLRRYTATGLL
jgi:hypothetical protein